MLLVSIEWIKFFFSNENMISLFDSNKIAHEKRNKKKKLNNKKMRKLKIEHQIFGECFAMLM